MNARKPHTRDEPRPDLSRGDYVRVSEDGIEPWYGRVGAIKPSFDTWRVEVEREDDGMTWSIALVTTRIERVEREGAS